MKYNDNGEYKDIYVKAFDTLPIGTEVDYDGNVVPSGWTEINNVLWTNSNPSNTFTSQNIELSSGNYNYLEIYFKLYKSHDFIKSVKVEKGQNALLDGAFYYGSKNYLGLRNITYTDSTHLAVGEGRSVIQDGALAKSTVNDWIIPIKIIGYK